MSRGWKRYTESQITTGHPIKITIMAYERCILNMNIAKERIRDYRYREAEERILNTEQILNELVLQIDHSVYPDLADNLFSLYSWCREEIREMNMRKDAEKADGIIAVVQNLLDGFKGAMNADGKQN